MVICDENPTPVGLGEAYALATDGVMHFLSSGPLLSPQRLEALDAELLKRGLQKHPGKDETAKSMALALALTFATVPILLLTHLVSPLSYRPSLRHCCVVGSRPRA